MSSAPTASIVIPTRDRPGYLRVALASVIPQARDAGAEVLVVDDGSGPETAELARDHGVRVIKSQSSGLNAARNAGVAAAAGDPVVLIDDDIEAPPDWLAALLIGIAASPDCDVFGGPIRARLEGGGPRACGREPVPITSLDLGGQDRYVEHVWGANMAIRKRAFATVGPFDDSLAGRGDEEEWQQRYAARGGRIRYVARATIDHRRSSEDATLRGLCAAAYALGRTARRNDMRKRAAPSVAGELRTLAGCGWHTIRRRCAIGIVMAAHTAGRLREALAGRR